MRGIADDWRQAAVNLDAWLLARIRKLHHGDSDRILLTQVRDKLHDEIRERHLVLLPEKEGGK